MPTQFCQFGEESIIDPVFAGQTRGLVVDVGAADGVLQSQSRGLILGGWSAILIDPLPSHVGILRALYVDNPRVTVIDAAISQTAGTATLYPCVNNTFDSTLKPWWKKYSEKQGDHYSESITVTVKTLAQMFEQCGVSAIDFLTIDAEASDLDILKSNDWTRWRPRLVCAECTAGPHNPLTTYMNTVGYHYHAHTKGNVFWA